MPNNLRLSPPSKMKILSVLTKISRKKRNFSCNVLFHITTTVCLKYFVNDCSCLFLTVVMTILVYDEFD